MTDKHIAITRKNGCIIYVATELEDVVKHVKNAGFWPDDIIIHRVGGDRNCTEWTTLCESKYSKPPAQRVWSI